MAMTQAGMFLSQPPMVTSPSNISQPATVSMESAMTSRETRLYFMPSVPMEMPSEMVMVLKMTLLPPAASTPLADSRASLSMWMLQGVTWLHVLAMPTWLFLKSARLKPTAWSMAREAARSGPSTNWLENLRVSEGAGEAGDFFLELIGGSRCMGRGRRQDMGRGCGVGGCGETLGTRVRGAEGVIWRAWGQVGRTMGGRFRGGRAGRGRGLWWG